MAHFANLNSDNEVTLVLYVGNSDCLDTNGNETEAAGIAHLQQHHPEITGIWKQTSYNGNIRKNYAGIGYKYDAQKDAFIPPKPYSSWTLDEETCNWKSPVEKPNEENKMYSWNESTQSWDALD